MTHLWVFFLKKNTEDSNEMAHNAAFINVYTDWSSEK